MNKFFFFLSFLFLSTYISVTNLCAQNEFEGLVKFDRTVHDFGDILLTDGEKQCEFTLTNIGKEPIVINRVITSCGCTEPTWTKQPIKPGETGVIDITFKNDQGPYPFNKTITTYISGLSKPVILRIKGVAYEKEKTLQELYPFKIGQLGLREEVFDMGQIEQGLAKMEDIKVANISSKPVKVEFSDCPPGLELSISPNPVPANSRGVVTCRIDTKATSEKLWGKNIFTSSLSLNGVKQKKKIQVKTLIKENFSSLTDSQKKTGSLIQFTTSSINFGKKKAGEKITATFYFKNIGKEDLVIYKADSSEPGVTFEHSTSVPEGQTGAVNVTIDTTGHPSEEMLYIFTIITNSPTRPIVNIFITGTIE